MNFINNTEMAALVDAGMAETEVTKATVGDVTTTTIYAGAPYRRTVDAGGDNAHTEEVWKIRRTVVVEDGDTTTVTNTWAEGAWDDRATLTYQYL